MHLVFCVDNRMGLSFNGRRQSRDKVLSLFLLEQCKTGRLIVAPGSAELFPRERCLVAENPMKAAEDGDWCFLEKPVDLTEPGIESLILCRWNRDYPGDVFLKTKDGFVLVQSEEIPGSSHEKITVETYRRK